MDVVPLLNCTSLVFEAKRSLEVLVHRWGKSSNIPQAIRIPFSQTL